jgi:tetratricopeptide (TPR) repeat protein
MRALIVALSLLVPVAAVAAEAGRTPPSDETTGAIAGSSRAERLDTLFADLQAAGAGKAAKTIELRIQLEWLQSDDPDIDSLMTAAVMAMQMRAFPAAITLLDKVVEQKPDYAEGWNKRATVYYYTHEYDRSLADIERTLALEPRHFGALAGLGMIMQDTGNIAGAIAAFERAVAVNPSLTNLKLAIDQLKKRIGRDI